MKNIRKMIACLLSVATIAGISAMPASAEEMAQEQQQVSLLSPLAQENLEASNLLLECGFTIEQINEGFAMSAINEYAPISSQSYASNLMILLQEDGETYWNSTDWQPTTGNSNTGEYYAMAATTNFSNSDLKSAIPTTNSTFVIPQNITATFTYSPKYTRIGSIMYADGYTSTSISSITTLANGDKQQSTTFSPSSTTIGTLASTAYIKLITPNYTGTTTNQHDEIIYNPIKLSTTNKPTRGTDYANVSITTKDTATNTDYSNILRQKVIAAGDFDGNNILNTSDATQIANTIVTLNPRTTINSIVADANGDGTVGSQDLVAICKFYDASSAEKQNIKFW